MGYRGGYRGWKGRGGRGNFGGGGLSTKNMAEFNRVMLNAEKQIEKSRKKKMRAINREIFWHKVRKFLGLKPKNNRIHY